LLAKGQTEEATLALEGSLGPLRAEKLNIMLAPATRAYAECLAKLNRPQEADAIMLPLIEQTETTSPSYLLPELLRTRADILYAGGEHREAMSFYLKSLARAKYDGAVGWELRTALSLSRAWIDAGQEGRARTLVESTVGLFTEGFESGDVLEGRKLLGW
jgi:tetratricopeptide (TPR) repeat protein